MNFPVKLNECMENPKAREDGHVDREMYGLQPFHPLPAGGTNATPEFRKGNSRGSLETLDVLFSRYRPVLSLIAFRVLENHEEAEDAVRNCIRVASALAPQFEHEGAFRSWLARVLIDEAVTILTKQHPSSSLVPAGPITAAKPVPHRSWLSRRSEGSVQEAEQRKASAATAAQLQSAPFQRPSQGHTRQARRSRLESGDPG
jgi:DNA-directed RNA polymerase specialized sigma24 family protein